MNRFQGRPLRVVLCNLSHVGACAANVALWLAFARRGVVARIPADRTVDGPCAAVRVPLLALAIPIPLPAHRTVRITLAVPATGADAERDPGSVQGSVTSIHALAHGFTTIPSAFTSTSPFSNDIVHFHPDTPLTMVFQSSLPRILLRRISSPGSLRASNSANVSNFPLM